MIRMTKHDEEASNPFSTMYDIHRSMIGTIFLGRFDHTDMSAHIQDLIRLCLTTYEREWEPNDNVIWRLTNTYELIHSTNRWKVFCNIDTKVLVVAFRGTLIGDAADIISNIHAFLGCFENSRIFLEEWKNINEIVSHIIEERKVQKVIFCGHSLGVVFSIASHEMFRTKSKVESVVVGFNSATTPHVQENAFDREDIIHFLVPGDIVSTWKASLPGYLVQLNPEKCESALQRHNLRGMLKRNIRIPKVFKKHIRCYGYNRRNTVSRKVTRRI